MSMYHTIFGVNPLAGSLVNALGFSVGELHRFGRWRDTYLSKNPTTGALEVHVFTRNGGPNRNHWPTERFPEQSADCDCPACIMAFKIPTFKGYLYDRDEPLDKTYATIGFEIPESIRALMVQLIQSRPDLIQEDFATRHQKALSELKPGNPAFERLRELVDPMISSLSKKE